MTGPEAGASAFATILGLVGLFVVLPIGLVLYITARWMVPDRRVKTKKKLRMIKGGKNE